MDYEEDPDTGPTRREQESIDVIDKLRLELAAEKERRERAEERIRDLEQACGRASARIVELRDERDRLLAIKSTLRKTLEMMRRCDDGNTPRDEFEAIEDEAVDALEKI